MRGVRQSLLCICLRLDNYRREREHREHRAEMVERNHSPASPREIRTYDSVWREVLVVTVGVAAPMHKHTPRWGLHFGSVYKLRARQRNW